MKTKRKKRSKRNGHSKPSKPAGVRTLVAHIPDALFVRIKIAAAKADLATTKWVEGVCRSALGR